MKNLITILSSLFIFIFLSSCGTQSTIPSEKVQSLVESGEFTFMAEHANPTNYDVIKIMNSFPTGGSSQMLSLDAGYTIELKKNEVDVVMPYFGRMYTSSMKSDNSFRFTSKEFTVNRAEGSKGSSVFVIMPTDQQIVTKIVMEVFKNGKTYVAIQSTDRQPITYDGYITANTTTAAD
ncbi:protein of unknown function [Kaistella treverensis]|uniref:DUF4251 domain-containing protein n=1 Tax=Kaistella treverensis TaxID=631455 RepID=A0A1I3LP92_9FLAO|nr:DUF4251 domain-containing protein [Kaistella treverensis]SFI86578.1 protein of unknown function [Kaistella treverensis]